VATAFSFMLVGVWIKMAFLPLHGWLPNAYSLSPSSTSVLIAPLMTKVSVFLMIRIIFSIYSPDYAFFQHVGVQHLIVWAAALGILIASGLALAQTDLKRMLSYIIVAEVGYMVGGVWLANTTAMTGAILHIVNDALMTLCLFLAASAIVYRLGDSKLSSMKGLYRRMPLTMAAFTIGAFSMIGVPPTAGFFSKWYLILGGIQAGSWAWIYVAALLISSLINAILFFRIIEIAYFQGGGEDGHGSAMPRQEACAWQLSPLLLSAVALLAIGLAAGPLVEHLIIPALPAGF
jgi:multicomponent Na+:H+ antiporter subunit D